MCRELSGLVPTSVLPLLTPKSCYPSGESVPTPPFAPLWECCQFPQSGRSKKKGWSSEALPRMSNDKIQNSKGKPTFLFHASGGISGSGFRASQIWNVGIVSYLTVNRNAICPTNHLISYRIRLFDNPHILVGTRFFWCVVT